MSDDTTSAEKENAKCIETLTEEVKELQDRVERLEREMSAIAKMEGVINRIFKGGEQTDPE